MGFHDKQLHVFGFLAKVQAAYNVPETLNNAADGFLPFIADRAAYANLITLDPQYDGANGVNIKTLFDQKRTQQRGFMFKGNIPHRFRGAGGVYVDAVVPPWDAMMKGAGYAGGTAASTRTYTPIAAGVAQTILTVGAYMRGGLELWPGMNCLSNLTIEASGVAPPLCIFELMGVLADDPVDVESMPDITYAGSSVQPPVASGAVLSIGDFDAGVLKSWKFNAGRDISTVMSDLTLSEGIVGPISWGLKPRLTTVLAATALKTAEPWHDADQLNEYKLRRLATELGISLEYGVVDELGNHLKISCTSAQLESLTQGNEGGVATNEFVWQLNDYTIKHESEEASS